MKAFGLHQIIRVMLTPWARVKAFRSDDRGSVLLLTGMMAFLVAIYAVIAMDTSQAIYNRIIAQNAVDAAADASALWQARGCNLLQHLNNAHFLGNGVFAVLESAALATCIAAPIADYFAPPTGTKILCPICKTSTTIDRNQERFAKLILGTQKVIASVTPYFALVAANDAAQGSGADDLIVSFGNYVDEILRRTSGDEILGAFGLEKGTLSEITEKGSGTLKKLGLTVFALPLNSLSLSVTNKPGGDLPWKYPGDIGSFLFYPAIGVGIIWCQLDRTYDSWGWDDEFYFGNPGYTTWIAGKVKQSELGGLGLLRWLNGGAYNQSAEVEYEFMDQKNLRMYTGSAVSTASPLMIPPYLAIASSQVEGNPVVGINPLKKSNSANAEGKLIKVYLPFLGDLPGEELFIYH